MKRQLVAPAIYKHFKHTEDGILNNYLYATIGISYPTRDEKIVNMNSFKLIAQFTEGTMDIWIYEKDGVMYHDEVDSTQKLVVYTSLYNGQPAYARPLDMFLSEVDPEKYPDVKQKYRFELYRQDEPIGDLVYPPNTEL